ncbi:ATPase family gene 2 protein homolog A [Aedes albopictus]|uniref:AAA+ ATPase domain-containing protein n=1 Tax=Aedes albopictus TaxID=7160 RepID=A0ABM1ZDK3_AEDAL
MPPKTLKKEKPIWWKCEQCRTTVLTAELAKHQADCNNLSILSGFITERNEFHSSRLECGKLSANEELKDLGDAQLGGLILLGSSVMNKLELVLGDLVEVGLRTTDHLETSSFIRSVWPNDEKGSRVLCASLDEITFNTGTPVCIKPFRKRIPSVEVLSLSTDMINAEEILKSERSFLKLLHRHYQGRFLSANNLMRLRLCNKLYTFNVVDAMLREDHQELVDKLENMSLAMRYFKIDCNSKIVISRKNVDESDRTKITKFVLDNVGGLGEIIKEMMEIIGIALGLRKSTLQAPTSRGILLYGVSGSGKTMLVNSLANHFNCLAVKVDCAEIFSKFYGETEANLKKIFEKAFTNYPNPTIVVIEEIHNICPKTESSDIIKRISLFLVNLMDSLHTSSKASRMIIIGTTDNPDNLHPSLRRGGRIDYEFELPVPDASAREEILWKIVSLHNHNLQLNDVKKISLVTHGYVGADLVSLVGRAMHEAETLIIYNHLEQALQHVKPSAMREILIESPNVRWTDIGGQHDLKLQLRQIIDWPIHRPEIFARLGINAPRGLLMFGPPGCSKTMIAKAIATESKLNFLSIKGSELFSMWVGESERAVRELFRKARQVAPSIIFFDEIDAIGGERSSESGSSVKERVLAQILTEIDGVSALKNVKIIAATNRPDLIDKALMRPGRLDRIIYVRLPDRQTREEIFRIKLSRIPVAADVEIGALVDSTDGYSGSEIEAVCQEAVLKALEESFDATEISRKYFDHALSVVKPRTSGELLQLYDEYLKQQRQ